MKTPLKNIISSSAVWFWKSSTVFFTITACLFLPLWAQTASPVERVDKAVEAALLVEDWTKLADLLVAVNTKTPSPVLRLIKGHTYLALNKNNESFRLFAASSSADLAAWEAWASGITRKYPTASGANFYRADALARVGRYEEAVTAFSKAIELDPKNAYALNARAVLYCQLSKYADAGIDLAAAEAIAPKVADILNNRGMLRIAQQQGNIVRLGEQFKKVVVLSKDFALALHAIGCIELLHSSSKEEISNNFLLLAHEKLPEASPLFAANEFAYRRAVIDQLANAIASKTADVNAGMGIKREVTLGKLAETIDGARKLERTHFASGFGDISPSAWPQIESQAAKAGRSELSQMTAQEVQDFAKKNPDAATKLASGISNLRGSANDEKTFDQIARYSEALFKDTIGRFAPNLASKAAHDFDVRSKLSTPLSPDANLREAVKIDILRGAEIYKPSTHGIGNNTPDGYQGTIRKFSPGPSLDFQPAGATTDKKHIVWDTMPWPFHPLFGLLYIPPIKSNSNSPVK